MTEFDMAYHHNVAVKRSKRLIVLMMLDSPTDLYDNDASDTVTLRQYLRQYTYIDYPADDWLDKLLYALPLRGLLQNNEDQNNDDDAHARLLWNVCERAKILHAHLSNTYIAVTDNNTIHCSFLI